MDTAQQIGRVFASAAQQDTVPGSVRNPRRVMEKGKIHEGNSQATNTEQWATSLLIFDENVLPERNTAFLGVVRAMALVRADIGGSILGKRFLGE
jgi:hypothetical protein